MSAVTAPCVSMRDVGRRGRDDVSDIVVGLSLPNKQLPARWVFDVSEGPCVEMFGDAAASRCIQDEDILLRAQGEFLNEALGPKAAVVEFGPARAAGARVLLDVLDQPLAYVSIGAGHDRLHGSVASLASRYPGTRIAAFAVDYTEPLGDLAVLADARRRVAYVPARTLCACPSGELVPLLRRAVEVAGANGAVILGVDLGRGSALSREQLDDTAGRITTANLNLLTILNRDFDADFNVDNFCHRRIFDERLHRTEMVLVSRVEQTVAVAGHTVQFRPGESIVTQQWHHYDTARAEHLLARVGLRVTKSWTDSDGRQMALLCQAV